MQLQVGDIVQVNGRGLSRTIHGEHGPHLRAEECRIVATLQDAKHPDDTDYTIRSSHYGDLVYKREALLFLARPFVPNRVRELIHSLKIQAYDIGLKNRDSSVDTDAIRAMETVLCCLIGLDSKETS